MRRAIIAALAAVALLVSLAPPAGAHYATLTVSTECRSDGTWTASWRITNSEDNKVMDITAEDVTDFSPNPTPKSGASTDNTTHAISVESVTAEVTVDWIRHEPLSYHETALRPEGCVPPPPPTTTPPPPPPPPAPPAATPPPAVPVPATPEFTG